MVRQVVVVVVAVTYVTKVFFPLVVGRILPRVGAQGIEMEAQVETHEEEEETHEESVEEEGHAQEVVNVHTDHRDRHVVGSRDHALVSQNKDPSFGGEGKVGVWTLVVHVPFPFVSFASHAQVSQEMDIVDGDQTYMDTPINLRLLWHYTNTIIYTNLRTGKKLLEFRENKLFQGVLFLYFWWCCLFKHGYFFNFVSFKFYVLVHVEKKVKICTHMIYTGNTK